jgi:UDP-3-O-[3-hydroxymyristoyl] N-acetylglucosamine deacetylase
MRAGRFQNTISHPCHVSGRGYWSGQPITLTFLPAPAETGVRFVRTDLPNRPSVEAVADHRIDMQLRTRVANGPAVVDMIEHVMAALYGLQIDNVEVHCTGCEMPGLDGSSLAYALALDDAGRVPLRNRRSTLRVNKRTRIGDDKQWITVEPTDGDSLEIEYRLDYGPGSSIGNATYATRVSEDAFFHRLAPARTFISLKEAEQLQERGLAKHVTTRDLLVFDVDGPIDNTLRFNDECARHKALDLLGDLALTGIDLVGKVVAYRSGHQMNGQLAGKLRSEFVSAQSAGNQGGENRTRRAA